MKKYLFTLLILSLTILTAEGSLFIKEESNISKQTTKLIDELEDNKAVIAEKKEVKVVKKKITVLKKEVESNLIVVQNKMIDLKTLIANSFASKLEEKETLIALDLIIVNDFTAKYSKDLSVLKESKLKTSILKVVEKIKSEIKSFNELKANISEKYNLAISIKDSVLAKTPIAHYLEVLNKKFVVVNPTLDKIGLDAGRLIIFIFSIIGFIILGILFNKLLNRWFSKLSKVTDEDELENNNFDSIKKPLSFLFFLIGFQLGIEILMYPTVFPVNIELAFIIINTLNVVIIFNKLVDILFFITSHKKLFKIKRSEIVNLISKAVKIIIFIVGTVYILSKFGVDTTKIVASLGIGSLAIAFAAKDLIAKFFSGIKLIVDDSFSTGDWVLFNYNGQEGTIVDIGFINTRVRTFSNALLVIPNSKITEDSYINWSRRKIGRKLGFTLGLKYSSKKEDIQNTLVELRELLENSPLISPSTADFSKKKVTNGRYVSIGDDLGLKNTLMVHLSKFGDSAIEIDIYAFSKTVVWSEWREARETIMFQIMDILEKNNLELAFPSQSIYIEKEL